MPILSRFVNPLAGLGSARGAVYDGSFGEGEFQMTPDDYETMLAQDDQNGNTGPTKKKRGFRLLPSWSRRSRSKHQKLTMPPVLREDSGDKPPVNLTSSHECREVEGAHTGNTANLYTDHGKKSRTLSWMSRPRTKSPWRRVKSKPPTDEDENAPTSQKQKKRFLWRS